MSEHTVKIHKLNNGMTLVAEPMAEVSSAAFVFLLPMGVAYDPPNLTGTSSVLAELIYRGAGDMDNRSLNEQLDGLGLHRHSSIGSVFGSFGGALIADNLLEILKLHSEIITGATLDAEQFEACRELAVQSLDSLEDDPRQKIALLTREKYLPYPYKANDGRNNVKDIDDRVVRGGSWYDRPKRCRSGFRLSYPAWRKVYNVGFRIVIESDIPTEQIAKSTR